MTIHVEKNIDSYLSQFTKPNSRKKAKILTSIQVLGENIRNSSYTKHKIHKKIDKDDYVKTEICYMLKDTISKIKIQATD